MSVMTLRDAEPGDRLRVGALVLGGVADRADAEDEALTRHEARHRVDGADRAGVRDRAGGAGEVVGRDRVRADLADQLLVRGEEGGEVERVGLLDVGHEQRVRAVRLRDVDGEAEVHVVVAHDDRLAVDEAEARVHRRDLARQPATAANAMRWVKLTLPRAGAAQVVVQDLAVDLEQLRRHVAHRGGRRHVRGWPPCSRRCAPRRRGAARAPRPRARAARSAGAVPAGAVGVGAGAAGAAGAVVAAAGAGPPPGT